MTVRKFVLFVGLFFVLIGTQTLRAQSTCVGIILNEYCVTNVPGTGGHVDGFGQLSDWVEIKNAFTNSVSLQSYWLSNDKNNLFKWKFPSSFTIPVGGLKLVILSGRNTVVQTPSGPEYHANFTIDQCKGQTLFLTTDAGVIRDQIAIQPTKAGHTRGRVDCNIIGPDGWRLYTTQSAEQDNPGINNYIDYAPTPKIISSTDPNGTSNLNPNKGGFYPTGAAPVLYFKLNGATYDTTYSCYDIFYTLDGNYPVPGYPPLAPTVRYTDSVNSAIPIDKTMMVRAISVVRQKPACQQEYLHSFCETNTYFVDMEHNQFDPNFGIVSIAWEEKQRNGQDTAWFSSNGTYEPTVHVEYYDGGTQVSEGYGILNRPFNEDWKTKQKGFYISVDDRNGFGCNFEGNIFNVEGLGTTPRKVFPTLHLKSGDIESYSLISGLQPQVVQGTGIRDVFYQSLAAKYNLKVSPLHVKPVVTFVNGKYWGVYDLREVYDKYYENYYNGQGLDSLDLNFVHKGLEGSVSYWDNSVSTSVSNFQTEVYNVVMGKSMKSNEYNNVMAKLDKESFIDYMILNSYAMNSDIWQNNISLAKGRDATKPGGKWHFYLWNTPAIFNFTAVPTTQGYNNVNYAPCTIHTMPTYTFGTGLTPRSWNGHGNILRTLMDPIKGNADFQREYKNRYQDLMNGPLKCENILKHYDYVRELYLKEMKYHGDPASTPYPGKFVSDADRFDSLTNYFHLGRIITSRCYVVETWFNKPGCYGLTGPRALSIDVKPEGSGQVRLNSMLLDHYIWTGSYYSSQMSFKAIPTSTDYAFHHWEFEKHKTRNSMPLSLDSVAIDFNQSDNVVAVFVDKRNPIAFDGDNPNLPTGFTPNGDGNNEVFRPLGSGEYASNYEMTIWNRWGQEVFRSIDPLIGWDGNYKGQQALTGVYAFIITYKNIYNESKVVKGNVTLTR
jgi:gliding motility-associated-like protein